MFKNVFKLIFSRLFVIGLLLVFQIALLVLFTISLNEYFIVFHILEIIISILVMCYIINRNNEEPSFKILWAMLILTFPVFGILLFFIAGDNKMKKKFYKKSKNISDDMRKEYTKEYIENNKTKEKLLSVDPSMYSQSNYISNTTHMPAWENTSTEYLPIGEIFFERLIEKLKSAKHFIFMEFFILTEGKMLNTIVDILSKKVSEGVEVRVMYDDLGSIYVLRNDYYKYLESLGIKCVVFNKFTPILSIGHDNRDHRKIVVIDGYIGFTGGINLADEYINAIEVHGHWKDVGVCLTGDGVKNLTLMFLESWNYFRTEDNNFEKFMPSVNYSKKFETDGFVQPYGDTPLDNEPIGENVYLNIINNAINYVYINTPYLIIDYTMLSSLQNAAKRGVDVRIITPHIADKWYVHILTQSYYLSLIKSGVKIYEYTPGFIHAKSFVCDDKVSVIGSINLDYRSFYHHFECGVWLSNCKCISSIKDDFIQTQNKSALVTKDFCKKIPLINKIFRFILKFVAPLM